MSEPRFCFIVLIDQCNSTGYIPSVVYEDEAGHSPLIGNGELAEPWYWGRPGLSDEGWAQAQQVCAEQNAKLGLTPDDVEAITFSSMRKSMAAQTAHEKLEQILRR